MTRLLAFAVPLLAAAYLWQHLGRPLQLIGLVVLALALGATWPVALVIALALVPYSISLCWPRRARAWWRNGGSWWWPNTRPRGSQAAARIPGLID